MSEICKSLILQEKCKNEIFLSPDIIPIAKYFRLKFSDKTAAIFCYYFKTFW